MRLQIYWQASADDAWELVSDEPTEPTSPGLYEFKVPESVDVNAGNCCFYLAPDKPLDVALG